MTKIVFSRKAENDIIAIDRYSYVTFGKRQADHYIEQLKTVIQLIANNPKIGRVFDSSIRPGYRCIDHESHIIYYRIKRECIQIIRILHKKREAKRHV